MAKFRDNPYPPIKFSARKNRDAQHRVVKTQRSALFEAVASWRVKCLNSGVLLDGPYVQGQDYVGEMPWPDGVTLRAAYNEFVVFSGLKPSLGSFLRVAKEVMDVRKLGSRNRRVLHVVPGRVIDMGRVTTSFYTFPRDHLTEPS